MVVGSNHMVVGNNHVVVGCYQYPSDCLLHERNPWIPNAPSIVVFGAQRQDLTRRGWTYSTEISNFIGSKRLDLTSTL